MRYIFAFLIIFNFNTKSFAAFNEIIRCSLQTWQDDSPMSIILGEEEVDLTTESVSYFLTDGQSFESYTFERDSEENKEFKAKTDFSGKTLYFLEAPPILDENGNPVTDLDKIYNVLIFSFDASSYDSKKLLVEAMATITENSFSFVKSSHNRVSFVCSLKK